MVFNRIVSLFENMISDSFKNIDIFIGLATAGIPLAAAMALRLNKPFAYVRSKAKNHGIGKLVEGNPKKNLKALIVDDTIASGGSINNAIKALKDKYDIDTVGISAIASMSDFGYNNKWSEFSRLEIPLKVLTNYELLTEAAIQKSLITDSQRTEILEFYKDPINHIWS